MDTQNAVEIIQRMGRGQLIQKLAVALQAAAEATVATGKKTGVDLKISAERIGDAESKAISWKGSVVTRIPASTSPETILYLHDSGRLSGDDPRQGDFFAPPRVVPASPAAASAPSTEEKASNG